jgi:hypothetical protein
MADLKGSKPSGMVDSTGIHVKNTINIVMEDLAEEDRKEVEQELEEEMVEIRRRKLACFQKTRNSVVKEAETASATNTKVTFPLSPKDLVHMVDVSMATNMALI